MPIQTPVAQVWCDHHPVQPDHPVPHLDADGRDQPAAMAPLPVLDYRGDEDLVVRVVNGVFDVSQAFPQRQLAGATRL